MRIEQAPIRHTMARPAAVRRRANSTTDATTAPTDTATLAGTPEAELTPKVRAAIESLLSEVARLRTKLDHTREQNARLQKLADEDPLLPIVNRRALVRELSRSMGLTQRYGTPHTLVYFDIDGMKETNDRFGHAAGDAVLEHVAKTLVAQTRRTDVVGRLGGDEFAVILGQTDEPTGRAKARSLAEAISAHPVQWKGLEFGVLTSFGAYTLTGRENAKSAIEAADRAMYEQKRARATTSPP